MAESNLETKIPLALCLVSQWRFNNLDGMPGKPISEARMLSKELNKVVFVCYNNEGRFLSKRVSSNLYVYTVPLTMSYSLLHTLRNLLKDLVTMGAFLSKVCKLHGISFIRADNVVLGGIPTLIASLISKTRYAIWLAGSEENVVSVRYGGGIPSRVIRHLVTLAKRIILSRSEFVLSVSAELLDSSGIKGRKKSLLTPNFVDLDSFYPPLGTRFDVGPLIFLYVGRFETEKGIWCLLDAIEKLGRREDYVVQLVGWGTLLPDILKAQERSLNVKYLGMHPHDRMPDLYRQAHILVLPSLTEGMPAAVLEAMATGMPVIVTEVGQLPQVVSNGKHGILLQPGNSNALRDAMLYMIENREKLGPIGNAARERVVDVSGDYIKLHRSIYQEFVLDRSRKE